MKTRNTTKKNTARKGNATVDNYKKIANDGIESKLDSMEMPFVFIVAGLASLGGFLFGTQWTMSRISAGLKDRKMEDVIFWE